jgi:type III secretion system HrpE/YscL family protein
LPKVIKHGPGGPPEHSSFRPSAGSAVSSGPKVAPRAPIIQKELVDANKEARRIVQEAELEGQRIREAAQAQADQTREQGYQDGYQEALASYTEQTTRALLQLKQKEDAIEAEFIKLVRVCVEKILSQEIKLHPDAVTGIVRNALQDARQQREIIVRVHPEDVEMLNKSKRRLLEVLARANTVEIREDNSIERGGCIVVTEEGEIDARIGAQLDRVAELLAEAGRRSDAPDLKAA